MVVALTVDGAVRESDLVEVMNSVSWSSLREIRDDTRRVTRYASNLAGDVLLHPVGHVDQAPPCPLEERHHAIHVAIARQRNFYLALAVGDFRLGLLQRVRLRQRLLDLAGHRGFAGGEFC